jgi:hypothetical protein
VSTTPDLPRQMRLMMFALNETKPGIICMDSACPAAAVSGVPHMANDGGPHPHPYGMISTPTHEWRRKPWWRRKRAGHAT